MTAPRTALRVVALAGLIEEVAIGGQILYRGERDSRGVVKGSGRASPKKKAERKRQRQARRKQR